MVSINLNIKYNNMKKRIHLLIITAIIAGCGHRQETTKPENSALHVTTEKVRSVKGTSGLHYSGTVEPSQTIPLTFQTNGTVASVLVEEGDIVKKGQILATIDKADNQSIYDAALAKYKQAQDAYDRLKSVYDKGSLTEIKWVEMETNLKQAESQVQIAQSNLEKCYMRAPDNGMIGNRNVEPGQAAISTGTPLELVKIDNVLVKIAVPENEISRIHKGQKAKFSISALNDKTFEGAVSNVSVVADRISRTYNVKIDVKNTHLEIKPGMVCDVLLYTDSQHDIMVVSYNAVSKDNDGKQFVYVVLPNSKTVKKQHITVGNYIDSEVEVLGGLSIGETIVNEGKEKLSDNSLIKL
jgi:RND family efflux transporter MFP subunit